MPKDLTTLKSIPPEKLFADINKPLSSMGVIVIRGITRHIVEKRRPDGSPQQRNRQSTVDRKGHNHPLIGGGRNSPKLAQTSTYKHRVSKLQLIVSVRKIRGQIAYFLETREKYPNYIFMGVSKRTQAEIEKRWLRYFKLKMRRWLS